MTVDQARKILGKKALKLQNSEVEDLVSRFRLLINVVVEKVIAGDTIAVNEKSSNISSSLLH